MRLVRIMNRRRTFLNASLLVAVCGLCTSQVRAQSTVRVVDRDSVPIPYALVSLGNAAPRATDASGVARFTAQLRETESFGVQRIGYTPFKGTASRSGDATFLIVLQPLTRGLDTVRTVAARETPLSRTGFYDRMERVQNGAISGEFITPEELELRQSNQISQMLQGRRSVTLGSIADGYRRRVVVKGRGGGCAMIVLLDGQRINDMLEDPNSGAPTSLTARHSSGRGGSQGSTSIDELVAAREIMAIEIYGSTANAPAELIPLTGGGSCGIVALWTGPRR